MEELLARVAGGDRAAFDRLYREFFGLVFHAAFAVLQDYAQTEEVTQEIFLELWSTAARYNSSQGNGARWMTMIARRRAVDRVRASQSARDRDSLVASHAAIPTEPDPAEHAVERAETRQVMTALAGLSTEQRQLLVHAYIRGVSYRELADMLGIPVNTVKSRVRLALSKLRSLMPR
ncbi:sigma-70 family RNA polymerase sigma factor [Amycolatopsis sp. H20-H5]|uniref:sigma-70 family RNA polymerase sigma factor n=1 Tax=Amycolatopsis sp. H20-H5 TaxID=3046309 RepID=UPI002DBD4FBA|nr:sigma-70 family RNA polymerase sigma factor [Amycolatopsis sp. H20-H5]MEC3980389.1 sigma-70 family RNA polymerase sigma factor [Amycolatopsis sp. H20-H5]